jgi:hypothetical protein
MKGKVMSDVISGPVDNEGRPLIKKLGTIDCYLAEVTLIVFKGRLYRFEYINHNFIKSDLGDSYFHFVDYQSGEKSRPFAKGYHLGNVFVENNRLYVTGTSAWGGERVDLFVSEDMENWEKQKGLNLRGFGIHNTSMCKADDKYVLMFEINRPKKEAGVPFTARFAISEDLKHWEVLGREYCYDRERFTAPHCLRYLDGFFYNFYVTGSYATEWQQYVARSENLIKWEESVLNPVLRCGDEDREIANDKLSGEQRELIANAKNINNSDIDFCEYDGKLIINYAWGDQAGTFFLNEAVYEGSLEQFLKGWF